MNTRSVHVQDATSEVCPLKTLSTNGTAGAGISKLLSCVTTNEKKCDEKDQCEGSGECDGPMVQADVPDPVCRGQHHMNSPVMIIAVVELMSSPCKCNICAVCCSRAPVSSSTCVSVVLQRHRRGNSR